ncbi:MAG: hypothetical protein ACW981_08275 [Candidatus Hodarchaeales archaeon]|jgi:hypothetical protein
MSEIEISEDTLIPLPNEELKNGSITTDILILLLKIFLSLMVITLFVSADFLFSIVYFIIMIYLFGSGFRDGYSIIHYYKGAKYINGRYLHKTKPICPFLLVSPTGFRCQAEFKLPFSMTDDFPRCHDQKLFKIHWQEKAPGILEKAKMETNMIRLRSYISALTNIGYEKSADFFLEILRAPRYSVVHHWIVDAVREYQEILKEDLDKIIQNKFQTELVENSALESFDIDSTYSNILDYFITTEALLFDENNKSLKIVSDEDLLIKRKAMKTRDNAMIKNGALVGLSKMKNLDALPLIIESLGKDPNNDKKLVNVLAEYQEKAIDLLKEVIAENEENLSKDKPLLVLEALGLMKNPDNFDYFLNLWDKKEADDDLLSSYLLSALYLSDSLKAQDLVFDVVYSTSIEDLAYDTAKQIIITDPDTYLGRVFAKLANLPDGDLSEEQEDIREISIILMEDTESFLLKEWFVKQEDDYKNSYIAVLKKEGQSELLTRLDVLD